MTLVLLFQLSAKLHQNQIGHHSFLLLLEFKVGTMALKWIPSSDGFTMHPRTWTEWTGLECGSQSWYLLNESLTTPKSKRLTFFYQTETVSCYIGPLNHTLPKPNFDRAKYIGKSIHDYTPCYHWLEEDPEQRFSLQYFDTQDTRKPVRMDFSDNERHRAMTFIFHEFDSCPQDKNLFTIPAEIQAQCNSF